MGNTPDTERDERLMTLFEVALSLPASERDAWVRDTCLDDPEMALEVLERLDWHERMGDFLIRPLVPREDLEPVLLPGDNLGSRIRINRLVAEGGMATVFEAEDDKLGIVAVKVPKDAFRSRLIAETRNALQVTHPNICRVHGIYTAVVRGRPVDFLTMEFLAGQTLSDRVRNEGPLPLTVLEDVARQLCAGLAEAHKRGVIHGDLKGNNVVLTTTSDGALRAVITDFGLARRRDLGPGLHAASLRGAPDFIAPELWYGAHVSIASDLYALGVLLFEAATGQRPPRGTTMAPKKLRADLPERWNAIIFQCMQTDPARRPSTAAAISSYFDPTAYRSPLRRFAPVAALLMGAAWGLYYTQSHGAQEKVRLAVLPPETDSTSGTLGAGIARSIEGQLAQYRNSAGPVILIPTGTEEAGLIGRMERIGATHLVRMGFRRENGGFRAWGSVFEVATKQDLKTFGALYSDAALASVPRSVVGTVASTLHLTGPERKMRLSEPALAEYLRGQGALHAVRPDLATAIEAFDRAASLDPTSGLPLSGKAEAMVLQFDNSKSRDFLEQAKTLFHEAESRDPDDVDVHHVGGVLYLNLDLPERAVTEYLRILQLEPGNIDAKRLLARAYSSTNPVEALRVWQQAVEQLPNDYRLHLDLGQFYYRRAQYREAIEHFRTVTQVAPELWRGFHNLGAVLLDDGQFEASEQAFQSALTLSEKPETLTGVGSIRAQQGRHADSVQHYERALAVGPRGHILLSNLGDAYRRTGRAANARSTYTEALSMADTELLARPRDGYVRAYVGYFCARLGDSARAVREISQALSFSPDDTKVVLRVALAHAALGNADAAARIIEATPSLKPEISRHPDLTEFRGKLNFTD